MPGFLPIAWELKYKTNIALNFGNFLKSAICGPSESPSIVQICSTGDVVDIVIVSRSCVVFVRTLDRPTYAFIFVRFFRSEKQNLNFVCCSKNIICIDNRFSILLLTDTGENVQKCTRVFSTRRWVILVVLSQTRRKKSK